MTAPLSSAQPANLTKLKTVHPFPARMAASIAFDNIRHEKTTLQILDPMVGSGTTLRVAKSLGHSAIGFDTDPLAVMIANVWCYKPKKREILRITTECLASAKRRLRTLKLRNAYPCPKTDEETRKFVRFWFDSRNRKELVALSRAIQAQRRADVRRLLFCAFSRMIITKQAVVSLAMDTSHSRPHKVRKKAKVRPLDRFEIEVKRILNSLEKSGPGNGKARLGDARKIPLESDSIDRVITSPPYFNAIDYLRGHKLSLVWMGNSIPELRNLRATNVGAPGGGKSKWPAFVDERLKTITKIKSVSPRQKRVLCRYIFDIDKVIKEVSRVLKPGGKGTFVIGDCSISGIPVYNSRAIISLAPRHGMRLVKKTWRAIPLGRRYLPLPSDRAKDLGKRMRREFIITLAKPRKRRKSA